MAFQVFQFENRLFRFPEEDARTAFSLGVVTAWSYDGEYLIAVEERQAPIPDVPRADWNFIAIQTTKISWASIVDTLSGLPPVSSGIYEKMVVYVETDPLDSIEYLVFDQRSQVRV